MPLVERARSLEIRVFLDCGHSRTVPEGSRQAECWTCGEVGSVVAAAY